MQKRYLITCFLFILTSCASVKYWHTSQCIENNTPLVVCMYAWDEYEMTTSNQDMTLSILLFSGKSVPEEIEEDDYENYMVDWIMNCVSVE